MPTTRRQTLLGLAATTLAPATALAAPRPQASFRFLFITDTHIEPELNAAAGVAQCYRQARAERVAFAIHGGDHVFDAFATPAARARSLMALYTHTEQTLGLKLHQTIGNHDLLGIAPAAGVAPTDPWYGKKYYTDNFGPLHTSFDHAGVHFVILDSIAIRPDSTYEGRIDAPQLAWLATDLASLPPGTPIICISHIPLVTAFLSYLPPDDKVENRYRFFVANTPAVLAAFAGHNLIGVLQGHTHINETVWWHGVPFITCGAVCGNWWHGTHFGTPEGYTVVSVAENRLTTTYRTYGFRSVAPQNT